ncbi:nitrite reductase small subunit NirD [Pseudomonas oryzihabitans]|uniref:nitrite reductase small subunit NirD n=1 Tax=Pseudomonas oryzihabitans TaxID=47885 RepID=UPI003EBDAAEF
MTQTNTAHALQPTWQPLCSLADLVPQSGVVALHEGEQVALFYLPDTEQKVFAVGNRDPKSGANVIGRGIVGQLGQDLVIASPLYKQHFRLADGGCLEYPEQALPTWAVRLNGERVEIA